MGVGDPTGTRKTLYPARTLAESRKLHGTERARESLRHLGADPRSSVFRHCNVVILTTSNITERIDVAFVDRADIRQYIGPPSAAAIFKIYLSCLEELMKVLGVSSHLSPPSFPGFALPDAARNSSLRPGGGPQVWLYGLWPRAAAIPGRRSC